MPYNGGPYGIKVGWGQGISTENMAYGPPFYGIRTPLFMPYEPFLLGVGVVFNLLKLLPKEGSEVRVPVPGSPEYFCGGKSHRCE